MQDDVPFSEVLQLLEKHGYALLKRRKYPGTQNAFFVIFQRPGSPNIGFPVENKRVAYEHYQTLLEAFEGWDAGEEPAGN